MSKYITLKIKDVCDFIGGSQPPKSTFSNVLKDGYIRLIQTRDYKTDSFMTYIPEKSTTKFCDEKDVMIGRYGPPIFQILRGLSGAYNVALLKAKPKNNIDNEYLYYFLSQNSIFKFVDKLSARTGGQTGVDLTALNEYPITLPETLTEQVILVEILTNVDAKIELNNKINAELESMAKLLYDYWFVQFDFPDENGKPYKSSGGKMVYNEELGRDIPEGWEVGSFEDIIDSLESGNRPKGGIENTNIGVPSIGAENILSIGKYNYSHEKLIPKKFFDKMTQGVVIDNDVLMYKDGASLGRVTMFKRGFPYNECSINSHAFIIRTNNKISQNYLYFWLDQSFIKDIIKRLGMKAAQPGINQSNVKSLPILIPNNNIINKFENLITPSIDTIFENAKQNRKLTVIRDFLLPMLMNGQVKVK